MGLYSSRNGSTFLLLYRASASLPCGASVAAITHCADTGSTVVELADGKLFAFIPGMYTLLALYYTALRSVYQESKSVS